MKIASTLLSFRTVLIVVLILAAACASEAQVSPAEVTNPQLKALESEYLPKLIALNRKISAEKHPFPFVLSRYVGVDPKNQVGMDTRGLEFVFFHDRTLLKFSGNYNAAFSAQGLTRNQRAAQVFSDIVVPVLRLLPQYFAENSNFDGFGFEISYHVREARGGSDYEGKENLVVVMSQSDALRFSRLADRDAQQSVLNASETYISGERYGLALGQADPLSAEEIAKPGPTQARGQNSDVREGRAFLSNSRVAGLDFHASPGSNSGSVSAGTATHVPSLADASPLTPSEVDEMQAKYQSVLDDFAGSVRASMGQTNSVATSLALFRNSLYLQVTLRNPEIFDKEKTSLYKRAALSFDTFLAPHLADLVSRIPAITNLKGLDVTVLVSISSSSSPSEAVEFACPLTALRSFASYDISNQDLIDQSLVIVNGVRISLNLQQVE